MPTCWNGLGLIPSVIVPHVGDQVDGPAPERAMAWLRANELPYQPLRDGEVLMLDSGEVTLLT